MQQRIVVPTFLAVGDCPDPGPLLTAAREVRRRPGADTREQRPVPVPLHREAGRELRVRAPYHCGRTNAQGRERSLAVMFQFTFLLDFTEAHVNGFVLHEICCKSNGSTSLGFDGC